VILGRWVFFSRTATRAPTCDVALRIVQRTERTLGRVQRAAPTTLGGTLAAMRFLGTSISMLANGPSEHEPVILTYEPAPLPAFATPRDHLRLHENAEALPKALG
jgi:hypothetical protein